MAGSSEGWVYTRSGEWMEGGGGRRARAHLRGIERLELSERLRGDVGVVDAVVPLLGVADDVEQLVPVTDSRDVTVHRHGTGPHERTWGDVLA